MGYLGFSYLRLALFDVLPRRHRVVHLLGGSNRVAAHGDARLPALGIPLRPLANGFSVGSIPSEQTRLFRSIFAFSMLTLEHLPTQPR